MTTAQCTHGVELAAPCDACFHAHMTREAPIRQVRDTRPRLTLHECTALQLAALAALDNVPAGLSESTCNDLRDALEKVNRAVVVLARPSGAATARPRASKSKQVATAEQRDNKSKPRKHHRR